MRDLPISDAVSMTQFNAQTCKVHKYNPDLQTVERPTWVPWPILWALSRTNPKHVFINKPHR